MNHETFILLENVDLPTLEEYSAPVKGAGYNLLSSLHTFTYELENFVGAIALQGTLEITPADEDWVDIAGTEYWPDGSTDLATGSFEGNYIWVRALYALDSGIIHRVRCNI